MPDQYLPQSALPIGQTPLDTIRAPQVQTNIPNPIDITNFFRMQQGIQGNLQLLQGVEQLKLRKQALDLESYEAMISDVDAFMGMTDNLVNRQYAQHKGNKENTEPTDIFAGLDDTNAAHYAIKQKLQPRIDEEQKRAQDIGIAYLKTNSKDPAVRAEALRGIQQSQSNIQRIIMDDPDFKKYKKQAYNYDLWHDRVTNPDSDLRKDFTVDPTAVAALEDKYQRFVNGRTDKYGNPIIMRDEDFAVDKYFYNSKKVLSGIQDDSKVIAAGTTSITQQQRPDGSIVPVEHTIRPSRDEAIDLLVKKWSSDSDAQKMARATGISLRDLAANTYNVEHPTGTEDVITDIGTLIKAPEGSTAAPGYKSMFGDTDGEAELKQVEADLIERGLDPKGTPMSRVQIGKLNAAYADPEKNVVEIPINDKGEEVDDIKDAASIKFVDRVVTPAVTKKGKVITPETHNDIPIAVFPKRKAAPTPVRITNEGSEKDDLGSRNNNPLNMRPVNGKGFQKYNTVEEGFQAGLKDMQVKITGDSTAMKNSEYMKSKYKPEELSNYNEVATVADLINVRTPTAEFGGDNTPKATQNQIDRVKEESGIDPQTKLSDLTPEQIYELGKAITKVESPDSWDRLFGERSKQKVTNPLTGEEIYISNQPGDDEMHTISSIPGFFNKK